MFELVVLLLLLILFFLLGVPVAFGLGITAVIGISIFLSPEQLSQMANICYSQGTSTTLMVAPLFILMSELISSSGLSKDIFNILSKWFKKIPGSLAISNVAACSIFAAICGSAPVTTVTIGKISIPEMIKKGYDRSLSLGCIAAAGNIGILIPPSLSLVIFGIITETSISQLFIAGIVPGLVLGVAFCLYIYIRIMLNPSMGGLSTEKTSLSQALPQDRAKAEKGTSLKEDLAVMVPIIMLIIIVLGTMYLGYVTPTEAGGVGAFGAFLIVLAMKRLNWPKFVDVLKETSKTTAMLLFLIIFGMAFAYLISSLGIPREVSNVLVSIAGGNKWVILILVLIFWIIGGCFLDPAGLMVISLPILYPPLIESGFEPLWIGVVSTLTICIGMLTPPVGLNLYVTKGITDCTFEEVVIGSMPFLIVIILTMLLLIAFPQIVTFLPNTM